MFSTKKFTELHNFVMDIVISECNVGRGRKSVYRLKYVLFILLTVPKIVRKWDLIEQISKMKVQTFEKRVIIFFEKFWRPLNETFQETTDEHANLGHRLNIYF